MPIDERMVEAAARAIYRRRFPHATIDDHFEWYARGADPDSCHYSNVEFAYIDARAALEAAEQAAWRPIEEAPPGTRILLWVVAKRQSDVVCGEISEHELGKIWNGNCYQPNLATHFRHLPAPPKE